MIKKIETEEECDSCTNYLYLVRDIPKNDNPDSYALECPKCGFKKEIYFEEYLSILTKPMRKQIIIFDINSEAKDE